MATYYVDDGGSSTSPYDTWAKAATSINTLDTAIAFASGDIVYFGHDHNCQAVNAASLTITGPTSGLPVIFISATTGSDPPAYQKGTGTQIDTTEGAFDITFDGAFSLYGILAKSGQYILVGNDEDETFYAQNCTFAPAANGRINLASSFTSIKRFKDLIVDLTQDGSTNRAGQVFQFNGIPATIIDGLTFVNAGFRTGYIFQSGSGQGGTIEITGADLSGFTNATTPYLFNYSSAAVIVSNCKTASTFILTDASPSAAGVRLSVTNLGATDDPSSLRFHNYYGGAVSSTSIYRSGGATIEGIANSWLVTTTANCNEYAPFHGPWLYSKASSTGSKTISLYITNDTSDFNDSQAWIEVEYLATSGSPLWTLASDQRATITTTAVAQDDDTTSTWVGSGPAYTYKQKLSTTVTIGEVGQIRARVVTGVASIDASRNFYIDPDADKMVA